MPTKLGHFEILGELAKSPTTVVYKANDSESGQTIALKAIQLSAFGEHATALEQALLAEAETTKVLSSPNITPVSGAGTIEGQFCAAMEYVQGNSIATMLARKEGFSIWDLLDIGRQLCSGLEHARSHNIVHYSLEPSKIMCGWDSTVRILSYGISSVGKFVQYVDGEVPSVLHYMSPEQVRGEATDARSNLFSLGAMLYEMVTERKAFDREDAEGLRQSILESTPTAPVHVNPKVHPLLSDLIMKSLAKDPAERYQSGRELLDDLEKCKESKPAKKAEAAKSPAAPKPVAAPVAKAAPAPRPVAAKPAAPKPAAPKVDAPAAARAEARSSALANPVSKLAVPKAAAAAAGAGGGDVAPSSYDASQTEAPEIDLSNQFISSCVKATLDSSEEPTASMSAAVADEPEVETFQPPVEDDGPKIAVDPMMAEGGQKSATGAVSFSEMTELPPLKEIVIPASPTPSPESPPAQFAAAPAPRFQGGKKPDEKPRIQPREVAEKAIKEIKGVPPKLMGYAIGGAIALIIVIGIGVTIYVHSLNSDDDSNAAQPTATSDTSSQPDTPQPAAKKRALTPAPVEAPAPVQAQPVASEPEPPASKPVASSRSRNAKHGKAVAPVVIPGQLAIDSTPQGAQVQVDGASDPSYVTPFLLTSLQPGQHSITVSKAGFGTDSRTVNVTSANRTTTVIHLAQLMATLIVKSDPQGASVFVDGRNVGTKTPAQINVDKGQHVVLVRMPGYIDETMNGQFALGQTFNFSPTLRSLGNTDDIKTVGKMSKLFGGKGVPAGQGLVTIRTQPKGAQVAINQRMLDKGSPVDVALDPGNYVVDITLSGYAPIHKVITADKGGKVVIDEVMQPQ